MTSRLVDRYGKDEMGRFVDKWWPNPVTDGRRPLRGVVVLSRALSDSELLDFADFIAELPMGGAWAEIVKGSTPDGLPVRVFLNPMRCCSIEIRFQFVPSDTGNRLSIVQSREDHADLFIKKMHTNLELLSKSENYTIDLEAVKAAVLIGYSEDQKRNM